MNRQTPPAGIAGNTSFPSGPLRPLLEAIATSDWHGLVSELSRRLEQPYVALYLRRGSKYERIASRGISGGLDSFQPGWGILGEAVQDGQPRQFNKIPNYACVDFGIGSLKLTSLIVFPIRFADEVVGVLELGGLSPLDQEQLAWLEDTGLILAQLVWTRTQVHESGPESRRAQHLSKVFTDAAVPIIIEDLEGVVIDLNPETERTYGWSREQLLGRPIKALAPPEYHQLADELLHRCRAGEKVRDVESVRWSRDGQRIPVLLTLSLLRDGSGTPTAIASMATSIRAQKEAERQASLYRDRLEERVQERTLELEKTLEELAEARRAAESSSVAKSEFLANVSHEIRTPMNAIVGLAHLLKNTHLTEQQWSYVHRLERSSAALLGLLDDVLDFSKIEAGKLELEQVEFQLGLMMQELRSLYAMRAHDKGLKLIFDLPADTPRLIGDPLRLNQLLTNLLTNALKFTEEGEVLVKVREVERQQSWVEMEFSVQDTGIGLEEAQLSQLFEAFSQADTSITRRYGGTGLGLAICRHLVQLMGGEIGVESTLGEGSRFWFRLPFETVGAAVNKLPPAHEVLLVEHNDTSRSVLARQLEGLRCRVTAVKTVEEALRSQEAALTLGKPFELVVLDADVPAETLRALLLSLRNVLAPPRVILTTTGDPFQLAAENQSLGAEQAVSKPLTPSDLHDILHGRGVKTVPPRTEARHSLKGRVLLVEDNPTNQQIMVEILRQAGLETEVAQDGQQAIEMVEQSLYDVILMDLQMPVLDGLAATKQIRSNGVTTPILALTANAFSRDRAACLEVGMDGHISKPIKAEELFSLLGDALAGRLDFDRPKALALMGGQQQILDEFLRDFLSNYRNFAEEFSYDDAAQGAFLAHRLAGSSGNLRLDRVYRLARQIEHACEVKGDRQELETAVKLVDALLEELYQGSQGQLEPMPVRLRALFGPAD